MATFHPFPRLPPELRAQIWRLTVEPRIVNIRTNSFSQLISSTPVPTALHTCHEARSLGLYQREWAEIFVETDDGVFAPIHAEDGTVNPQAAPYLGPRELRQKQLPHVWLNWDIDMASVGTTSLMELIPFALRVKRLRLERREDAEDFFEREGDDLAKFVNLEEIQIVCLGQLDFWEEAGKDYPWPCGPDNLFFIRPSDDRMMKAAELDVLLASLREEEH
ncbi:hypothetical protein PG984_011339 [Apiospora sp. TS-2023a]